MKFTNGLNPSYLILQYEKRLYANIKRQLDIFDNMHDINIMKDKVEYFIKTFHAFNDSESLNMHIAMHVLLKYLDQQIFLDNLNNTKLIIEKKMSFFIKAINKSINLQNYILSHENAFANGEYNISKLKIFLIDLSMHINHQLYKLQSKDITKTTSIPIKINILQLKHTNMIQDPMRVVLKNIDKIFIIVKQYYQNLLEKYLEECSSLENILHEMKSFMLLNLPDHVSVRVEKIIFKTQKTIFQHNIFADRLDKFSIELDKYLNYTRNIFVNFANKATDFLKEQNAIYHNDKTENMKIFNILTQQLNGVEKDLKTNYNLYELQNTLKDVKNLSEKINHNLIPEGSFKRFNDQMELLHYYVDVLVKIDCYTDNLVIIKELAIDNSIEDHSDCDNEMVDCSLNGDIKFDE